MPVRPGVRNNRSLAGSDSIEGLYRALLYFQLKILEHVRIAKDANEAKERAEHAVRQIRRVMLDMLMESAPQPRTGNRAADDAAEAARIASNRVRDEFNALRSESQSSFTRCPPPHTWDPITETCV